MVDTKRVGVLTGGGDAPGLNPAIKGLVYRGSELGLEVIGLFDGWRSLLNPAPDVLPLDRETVRRWDRDGGTNLGDRCRITFRLPTSLSPTAILELGSGLRLDGDVRKVILLDGHLIFGPARGAHIVTERAEGRVILSAAGDRFRCRARHERRGAIHSPGGTLAR